MDLHEVKSLAGRVRGRLRPSESCTRYLDRSLARWLARSQDMRWLRGFAGASFLLVILRIRGIVCAYRLQASIPVANFAVRTGRIAIEISEYHEKF